MAEFLKVNVIDGWSDWVLGETMINVSTIITVKPRDGNENGSALIYVPTSMRCQGVLTVKESYKDVMRRLNANFL